MSDGPKNLFARGEEFLQLFNRGAEFTRELLQENERLRAELMRLENHQRSAARDPHEWAKLRQELLARIHSLEEENELARQRVDHLEHENNQFAQRYLEIEEENNNLANLYVASYQLHSTLDIDEVMKVIIEIVINLIGADLFAIYLLDEHTRALEAVGAEGREVQAFPAFSLGEGDVGRTVESGETLVREDDGVEDLARPLVCIPLLVQNRPVGAIAVYGLLEQKEGFSPLDHELFTLLGGHAATAIFASRLYSQSARKLNTIQGFIELLTR